MTIRRRLVALVASVGLMAGALIVAGTQTARADVDVYTTPGQHTVNGRQWRTTCSVYSPLIDRCRTEIWATQVVYNGKFEQVNGWVFNNLTYLVSPREAWAGNPLGRTGSWTSTDGRKWRTECDTKLTGSNGCRSFAVAKVIESYYDRAGSLQYRWVTKEIFNNMVRFTTRPQKINRYQVFADAATWFQARGKCVARGGYLAVISSKAENKAAFDAMRAAGAESAYFGYLRGNDGPWAWVHNENSTYTNWAPGEPNNEGDTERFGMFYFKNTTGTWNDGNFGAGTVNDPTNYLCEFPTKN